MGGECNTKRMTTVGINRHDSDVRFMVTPKFVKCIIMIDDCDVLENGVWKCSIINPNDERKRTISDLWKASKTELDGMQPGVAARVIVCVNSVYTYHSKRSILTNGCLLSVEIDQLCERLLGDIWVDRIMSNLWHAIDETILLTYESTCNDAFDKEAIESEIKKEPRCAW